MSTSWTAGYMTEINYTFGFYRELTPAMLQFAMTAANSLSPSFAEARTYCELGCGQGLSTNLLAAANPHIEFYATDFNPGQIAGARSLSKAANTKNVHFYEDSFVDFSLRSDLPSFDIIALHGIYSWINAENRSSIVSFIHKHLKPGGLVYISYNALPGWASASPLRRLFSDYANSNSGSILNKVENSMKFSMELDELGARYFKSNPGVTDRLQKIKDLSSTYLAHEYFNNDWTPFYHSDVAKDLGGAKLSFATTSNLLDQIDAINLTVDQQKFLANIPNVSYRETLRDYILNQQFRRDIFVKGLLPLRQAEILTAWEQFSFVLSVDRVDVPQTVKGALGDGNLQPEVYGPVLEALEKGPIQWDQLMQSDNISPLGYTRVMQALAILIGLGVVQPCLQGDVDHRRISTDSFNLAVMEKACFSNEILYLASPVTGGAIMVDHVTLLFLLAIRKNKTDICQFVLHALLRNNQRMVRDGNIISTDRENLDELQKRLNLFQKKQRPLLERVGIL